VHGAPGVVALLAVVLVGVGGCGLLDRAPAEAEIVNRSDQDVVLRREEPDGPRSAGVDAGGSVLIALDGCSGTGFVVETATGTALATVDEPLCPRTRVEIGPDGSVTYTALD
jgi:hypothetical protein